MSRLLRLAVGATLVAGAIGVLRQRREAQLARRTPAAADRPAGIEAAAGLGALARALATWTPPRPHGPMARLATGIWAAPLTAVGLAVGAIAGGTPRWSEAHGCIVFEGAAGLPGRILEAVGARANAIGQVVIVRGSAATPELLAHEALHVRQAERLGPLLFPLYLWLGARYGYRDHPLERAARLAGGLS